jgi:DNA repair protein RecO (recombination protein O)
MTDSHLFKTEAIVLKRSDLGEADRLLALFTPQLGRIRAVAKGARKITSRLGGHVELFTHVQLLIARGRNLDFVTQAQTIDPFISIRDDLTLLGHACYLAELVDQIAGEHIANEALYALLVTSLRHLPQARDRGLLLRHFEVQLLSLTGYRQELRQCVVCRQLLEPVTNSFSPAAGGVLCPRCAPREPIRREISVDMLKCLRYLQDNDYPQASRLRLAPQLLWDMERLLGDSLRYTLERDLKSAGFLHTLRHDNASRTPEGRPYAADAPGAPDAPGPRKTAHAI